MITPQGSCVYIAGPMTGIANFNYEAFHRAARWLRDRGHGVVSPAEDDHDRPLTPPSPQDAAPHGHYLRAGLRKLLHADGLALLPGWESSTGVGVELTVARAIGMDIRPIEEWT